LALLRATEEIIPTDPTARVVWAVLAGVILGLYFIIKSTRRRATEHYWERRRTAELQRAADPDMRDPTDDQ